MAWLPRTAVPDSDIHSGPHVNAAASARATPNSSADWKRSESLRNSACMVASAIGSGTAGPTVSIGTGSSESRASAISIALVPSGNGSAPVSISYNIAPDA